MFLHPPIRIRHCHLVLLSPFGRVRSSAPLIYFALQPLPFPRAAAASPPSLSQITMNDGYKYGVLRRYSQFDQLRERVARVIRTTTPPFPPKSSIRSSTVGLGPAALEERR